jgi:hypothetical protein
MRTLKHILTFILFGCVISCKKYGHGYISGTVYENGTELPIQGASVILRHSESTNCKSCATVEMFDSTLTDSQGKFILYFDKERKYEYSITVRDKMHYELYGEKYAQYGIAKKKTTGLEFYMDPFAYLRIRVNKTSNSNNSLGCKSSVDNSSWINGYHHDGSPIDTIFPAVHRVPGNRLFSIYWVVTYYPVQPDPNGSATYENVISVNKGDTLTYLISYN